jgi:hypothetical protein
MSENIKTTGWVLSYDTDYNDIEYSDAWDLSYETVEYIWISEFKDDCDEADLDYSYVLDLIDNKGLSKNIYFMFINILKHERWTYGHIDTKGNN